MEIRCERVNGTCSVEVRHLGRWVSLREYLHEPTNIPPIVWGWGDMEEPSRNLAAALLFVSGVHTGHLPLFVRAYTEEVLSRIRYDSWRGDTRSTHRWVERMVERMAEHGLDLGDWKEPPHA